LELLKDPSVCRLYRGTYGEKLQLWMCSYRCPGPKLGRTIYIRDECSAVMKRAEVEAIIQANP
jgi:hypothetical protein